jgi:hypothetical protein
MRSGWASGPAAKDDAGAEAAGPLLATPGASLNGSVISGMTAADHIEPVRLAREGVAEARYGRPRRDHRSANGGPRGCAKVRHSAATLSPVQPIPAPVIVLPAIPNIRFACRESDRFPNRGLQLCRLKDLRVDIPTM